MTPPRVRRPAVRGDIGAHGPSRSTRRRFSGDAEHDDAPSAASIQSRVGNRSTLRLLQRVPGDLHDPSRPLPVLRDVNALQRETEGARGQGFVLQPAELDPVVRRR
jgi:hypothetical protein